MKWRCKLCGKKFDEFEGEEIWLHFQEAHPNHDIINIIDNLIEEDEREDIAIKGVCLVLTKLYRIEVIEKNGKFYKTNHKGLEEEITKESILEEDKNVLEK